MSYTVRIAAKWVNVTPVIRTEVTEALYKREKMLVLSSAAGAGSEHCYNQELRS
jgi:hypothetical protein